MDVQTTDSMHFPLEVPNGWYLFECRQKMSKKTDKKTGETTVVPEDIEGGSFIVIFKGLHTGRVKYGRGSSLKEAWESALKAASYA